MNLSDVTLNKQSPSIIIAWFIKYACVGRVVGLLGLLYYFVIFPRSFVIIMVLEV
jgi:hypothetical protein